MRRLRPAPAPTSTLVLLLTLAYIGLVAGWMLWNGIVASPDYLLLLLAPVALLAGRIRAWFTVWVPFVSLLLLWEGMRSLADRFSATGVHWGGLRLELELFGGQLPGVWMQHLGAATPISWLLDRAAVAVDLLHFPAIVAMAVIVWLIGRRHFLRYSAAFFATGLAALVIYVLAPTAPPWYAAEHGMIHGLS